MECHEAPLFLMVVISAEYGAGPGLFVFVIVRITSVLKVTNKYDILCDSLSVVCTEVLVFFFIITA